MIPKINLNCSIEELQILKAALKLYKRAVEQEYMKLQRPNHTPASLSLSSIDRLTKNPTAVLQSVNKLLVIMLGKHGEGG